MTKEEPDDFARKESHYHFKMTLRLRHPDADPDRLTRALGMTPARAWKAGDPRQTPRGVRLKGVNRETYWYLRVFAGRHPDPGLSNALLDVLERLSAFRAFFHTVREEGGSVELFISWCFECQSGDIFVFTTLGKAADLRIDLTFDVYPPTQQQNEYEFVDNILPPRSHNT